MQRPTVLPTVLIAKPGLFIDAMEAQACAAAETALERQLGPPDPAPDANDTVEMPTICPEQLEGV